MTVKELKEELNKFDDNLTVLITSECHPWYTPCVNVAQGINELDGCIILDDYDEEDDGDWYRYLEEQRQIEEDD